MQNRFENAAVALVKMLSFAYKRLLRASATRRSLPRFGVSPTFDLVGLREIEMPLLEVMRNSSALHG